jgi:hypothetical protein
VCPYKSRQDELVVLQLARQQHNPLVLIMQFSTALVALVLAVAANAASTPFRRDDPPTEPGLLHFLTDDCEVTDYDNGEFIAFSNLPPCNGNCGPCLGTSYFRSVIAYSPDSNPLPYDVRRPRSLAPRS